LPAAHWSDAYYGALYFDSAADLLSPALSKAEAGVIERLLAPRRGGRILDLACGHGRHAWPLAGQGLRVVGLERSGDYLRRAASAGDGSSVGGPDWLRGDVRALPLRDGAFDGAFSWYSSLFMFDDELNLRCLREMGRVVARGGRLLIHHANPLSLALQPVDRSRRVLPDGTVVEEESRWDAAAGVDRCARRLVRTDGTVLTGTAELRYYGPAEWGGLAAAAGLRLVGLTATTLVGPSGGAPTIDSPDLIAVLERPT
jgi:ubiquinone/menaquinone biosynthesis C-methylase UbiE